MSWEMGAVRTGLVALLAGASYHLRPFHLAPIPAIVLGAVLGIILVGCEIRLQNVAVTRLLGAAVGLTIGILAALMVSRLLSFTAVEKHSLSYIQVALLIFLAYLGMVIGAAKGQLVHPSALGGIFSGEDRGQTATKLLDTSVIIDGRICDVCETGFIDGTLIIPQFVLRELQQVADSSDSLKRNRGRRGLDMLQRIQSATAVRIEIVEDDFPKVRGVDLKLIELAKARDAKIVTNDFNLNKVAQLQGVQVLNVNDLANSLKPVVLPGETMRVFIVKEGKEHNQGVAYLDDGTMVVVDNARKMISKTVDVSVTSVLQTTAGRMIFGRYDDRLRAEPLPIAQSS